MSKKILSLLLVLVMLTGVFAACAKEAPEGMETSSAEPITTTDTAETTGCEIPEPEWVPVPIIQNGQTNYVIIYDEDLSSSTKDALSALLSEFAETFTVSIQLFSDEEDSTVNTAANEIVVGNTNRPESGQIASELRADEYVISYDEVSTRIIINGTSDAEILAACTYFLETYANQAEQSLIIQSDLHYTKTTKSHPIQTLTVDGVSIARYAIVVPNNCDLLTYYAGLNLRDHIYNQSGYDLKLVYDNTAEQAYEILVGNTNRAQSNVGFTLSGAQYVLMQNGTKLVMKGEGVYAAAGVGVFVSSYLLPDANDTVNRVVSVKNLPTSAEAKTYTFSSTYQNAILMIGDGMGHNHVNAALANGMSSFVAEGLPVVGEAITRSYDVIYNGADWTDSAAAATAMATGYKTKNYALGQDHAGNDVQNLRELAAEYGAQTAVLSTDALTGATPGAFLAHSSNRNNSDVATEVNKAKNTLDFCKGSISGENLTTETRNALKALTDSSAPFFMMVEEGHIDKRSHSNDMAGAIEHVKYYNDVIAYVICFVLCHPDTALIITADHETGGIVEKDTAPYGYMFTTWEGAVNNSKRAHTNQDVPLYAFGAGVECFHGVDTENIEIAKFIAKAFGDETFGQDWDCPPVAA